MPDSKVLRHAYRRTRQAELAAYAANIVRCTKDNPVYAAIRDSVVALDTVQQQYAAALAASRNGGRPEMTLKDSLKEQLVLRLNEVATATDVLAAGDANLIVGAGFQVARPPLRLTGDLYPPVVVRLSGTGRAGEVRAMLNDGVPSAVTTHSVEYSIDKGGNWQNGAYNSRRNFVISHLPNGREVWLRFRAIGFNNRKSEWSAPVTVAVA